MPTRCRITLLALVVCASFATATESAARPLPRRLAAAELGFTSSDHLAAGLAVYPLPGLGISGWIGVTEVWGTRGVGATYTFRLLDWEQKSASLWLGAAGRAELRLGFGAAVKTFDSCVFFCVEGDAVDGFVRLEAVKYLGANLGGQMIVDVGASRIDPDDAGDPELHPYVGLRFGLVVGLSPPYRQ